MYISPCTESRNNLLVNDTQCKYHSWCVQLYIIWVSISTLMGVVQMTLCVSLSERAMAYSATTVFPAEVCADTNTDWQFSMHRSASFWNGSSTNGYSYGKGEGEELNSGSQHRHNHFHIKKLDRKFKWPDVIQSEATVIEATVISTSLHHKVL